MPCKFYGILESKRCVLALVPAKSEIALAIDDDDSNDALPDVNKEIDGGTSSNVGANSSDTTNSNNNTNNNKIFRSYI